MYQDTVYLFNNIVVNLWTIEMTSCSFARAASTIQCGNRQEKTADDQLLLTSLEALTAQIEAWKIQEKDVLLNRAGTILSLFLYRVLKYVSVTGVNSTVLKLTRGSYCLQTFT